MSGPIIIEKEWGRIRCTFLNHIYNFKDCILTPNRAIEWDWKIDGTRHNPGITVEAIKRIINESDIIILSRGVNQALQVAPDTVNYLKHCGKRFQILQTWDAIKRYNDLAEQGIYVGGLFHSTC